MRPVTISQKNFHTMFSFDGPETWQSHHWSYFLLSVRHPDFRVKHCAYGQGIATLLNPCGVTAVSHKYSLTVARHTTAVVTVPSTVHCPANYEIKIYY
jgi:hypothetical protein